MLWLLVPCTVGCKQHFFPLLRGTITEKQDQLLNCVCKNLSDFICEYLWVLWFEVCCKVPCMIFKRTSVSHMPVCQKCSAVTLYIFCWAVWCTVRIVLHLLCPLVLRVFCSWLQCFKVSLITYNREMSNRACSPSVLEGITFIIYWRYHYYFKLGFSRV